ncbi:hypothetical protein AB0O01_01590 [Streptomyces sp. NPDC093252]|uniref:hypothetical protein n=1 Tax=Streptomyces sp. NPDC093252 TaxID=3154980 RepID=UPI00342719EA
MLEFKGWWREQWQRGKLTELFFLDEATALAAGHRPCGLCRVPDYRRFKQAWAAVAGEVVGAPEMDLRLAADRRTADWSQRTFQAAAGDLPGGVFFRLDGRDGLWARGVWRPWSMAGYGAAQEVAAGRVVEVLTPAVTVGVIAAGYAPVWHPSAGPGPDSDLTFAGPAPSSK